MRVSIMGRMGGGYLRIKVFDFVIVASWFAGLLFYLPRLFVNLATVPSGSHAELDRMLLMAHQPI